MLITREETISIPNYIEMDKYSRDNWDKLMFKMHSKGTRTIVYAKTYLSEADKDSYLEKYETLNL